MSDAAANPFSADLPLSRSMIDRDYLTRARPGVLVELLADDATRVVVLSGGNALLAPNAGAAPSLAKLPGSAVPPGEFSVYLGRTITGDAPGIAMVAVVLTPENADALDPDPEHWGDLRVIGADLDALDSGLFTEALAIANWHATHGFSPRTGEPTVPGLAGWVRYPAEQHDEESGTHVFPRTDPAIIVGVIDDHDRILLGANARWGGDRYSVLAGFVEPGESFEAAVVREIGEESGLTVVDPVYFGSQPWPFPASIMIGFTARVAPGTSSTPVPDGVEIMDLRWFSRDDLSDVNRTIGIPGRASIARAIIEQWFGGPLDAP